MITTTTSDPSGSAAVAVPSLRSRVLRSLSPANTPGLFRLLMAVAVAACLVYAVVGSAGFASRSSALSRAARIADELLDVQQSRAAASQADALASTSYLVGGAAETDRRGLYEAKLSEASSLLTAAAATATPNESDLLQQSAASLTTYGGLIEQARANNRQGNPLGAAYQRAAATELRTKVAPPLDQVVSSSRARLNDAMRDAARSSVFPTLFGILAAALLVVTSLILATRTNRTINVAIVAALVLVVLSWLFGSAGLTSSRSRAADAVERSLTSADALARVRTGVADARAAEALRLISRGSGQAFEQQRAQAVADASVAAEAINCSSCVSPSAEVAEFGSQQQAIVETENANWDEAVAAVAQTGRYEQLIDGLDAQQQSVVSIARVQLTDSRGPLGSMRIVTLLAGLLAAVLVAVGLGQRLKEYR